MNEEVFNFLIEAGIYLSIEKREVIEGIIFGNNSIPSLDGKGKMSKSKGEKTVINLTDDLETIRKKISKIPTNKENWHILFSLYWNILSKEDRDYLANKIVQGLLARLKK